MPAPTAITVPALSTGSPPIQRARPPPEAELDVEAVSGLAPAHDRRAESAARSRHPRTPFPRAVAPPRGPALAGIRSHRERVAQSIGARPSKAPSQRRSFNLTPRIRGRPVDGRVHSAACRPPPLHPIKRLVTPRFFARRRLTRGVPDAKPLVLDAPLLSATDVLDGTAATPSRCAQGIHGGSRVAAPGIPWSPAGPRSSTKRPRHGSFEAREGPRRSPIEVAGGTRDGPGARANAGFVRRREACSSHRALAGGATSRSASPPAPARGATLFGPGGRGLLHAGERRRPPATRRSA